MREHLDDAQAVSPGIWESIWMIHSQSHECGGAAVCLMVCLSLVSQSLSLTLSACVPSEFTINSID